MAVDLNLSTTITQSGQIAHQSDNALQRRQHRGIEVIEVAEGRVRRAEVAYRTCRQTSREGAPGAEPSEPKSTVQPVEGKSYFVTRDGEQLRVADAEGNIPPLEEYKIVAEHMQTLGKPNPLAKFLLGRQFAVGDRIELPKKLAEELLGLGDSFGEVQAFELKLLGTEQVDGQPCARFSASIKAAAGGDGKIAINLGGEVWIQLATCRTVDAKLSGPVALSAMKATWQGSYQHTAKGGMKLAIHSFYAPGR